jgi:CelD/BcsL family acetyltransferase involved in cellulose biosynthesis
MTSPAMTRGITFVVEPLPSIEELEALWRRFDRGGQHSFFLTWTWIGTWLKCLPKTIEVVVLKAMLGPDTIGIALLTLRESSVRGVFPIRQAWLNCTGDAAYDCLTIEHNGLASEKSWAEDLLPALHEWFAAGGLAVDECVLSGVEPGSRRGKDDGLLVVDRREPGYRTPLRQIESSGGLLSVLSRNGRQQLRRSLSQCEEFGALSVDRAEDSADALEFFVQMKDLHVQSWARRGRRHAFTCPFFETFHRALIPAGIAEGSVDLLRVKAGPHTLGYLYNFRRNGIVFSYQSGFDDAISALRPGYVCHALAIEYYTTLGMAHYDFLAERNRLKESFGTEPYELVWRRLRRPTWGFRIEAVARKAITSLTRKEGWS